MERRETRRMQIKRIALDRGYIFPPDDFSAALQLDYRAERAAVGSRRASAFSPL